MMREKLLITTTVPETFKYILNSQLIFLEKHFSLHLATNCRTTESYNCSKQCAIYHVPMVRNIHIFRDIIAVIVMVKLLLKLKPKLVHSYTPKAGLITMFAAWLCRVPVRVHTFTGLIFPTSHGLKRMLLIWADRLISACATDVIPEGQGVKNDLQNYHITRKPLSLIGHGNIAGVDTSLFSIANSHVVQTGRQLGEHLRLPERCFKFVYIGRLNKDKGLCELIQAFNLMPIEAHLLLAGNLDSANPVDQKTMSILQIHPRIHLLGLLQDVRPVLYLADVVVLPSYREGFPNVLLEAGAMSLPAIATNVNGSNEIIIHGQNGWLVPPRDHLALYNIMLTVLMLPEEMRIAMGRNARTRVGQLFEQKNYWQCVLQFYHNRLSVNKIACVVPK